MNSFKNIFFFARVVVSIFVLNIESVTAATNLDVGSKAPPVETRSLFNEKIIFSLYDWFDIQGKKYVKNFEKDKNYLLLYFYSAECSNCANEIASLDLLAKKYYETFSENFPLQVFIIIRNKTGIPESIANLDHLQPSQSESSLKLFILYDKFHIVQSHYQVNPNHYCFIIDSSLVITSKSSHDKRLKDLIKDRLGFMARKPSEQLSAILSEFDHVK